VTAYAGRKYPQVFSRLGVVSPSTFWGNNYIVGQIQSTPAGARPTIVYVDSGAGSGDDQADTDLLAAAYVGVGYVEGVNFRHVVQAGATHSEVYWAQRLPGALQLMLGVR
jgi:predicted alpha/beta superfamily hydrolase